MERAVPGEQTLASWEYTDQKDECTDMRTMFIDNFDSFIPRTSAATEGTGTVGISLR